MSRQSPTGFVFSVMFEIVAVVAVVSLLPRIDLRPTRSAAASQENPAMAVEAFVPSPVEFRPASGSFSTAPPLIESPSRPQYVEERLDRASQKLMNSVGGAVNQVTDDWLRPQAPPSSPQPMQPQSMPPQPTYAARPAYEQPPRVSSQPPAMPPPAGQQRRWLKY